jgi:hypothetical protein
VVVAGRSLLAGWRAQGGKHRSFHGYAPCETDEPEAAVEKVALYVGADGRVLHAARQLPDGAWTSKLGEAWDISHELRGLEGDNYGRVARILKRPRATQPGP